MRALHAKEARSSRPGGGMGRPLRAAQDTEPYSNCNIRFRATTESKFRVESVGVYMQGDWSEGWAWVERATQCFALSTRPHSKPIGYD